MDVIDRREQLERLKSKLLRGTVIVMAVLGVVAAASCWVPSVEVWTFADHGCVGLWETSSRGPVEHPLGMAVYFLLVLAPGVLVWRKPTLERALLWSFLTLLSSIAMLVVTVVPFDDPSGHVVQRWPAHVFAVVATSLVANLLVTLPIGCLGFAIAMRKRPPPRPELPRARVIVR